MPDQEVGITESVSYSPAVQESYRLAADFYRAKAKILQEAKIGETDPTIIIDAEGDINDLYKLADNLEHAPQRDMLTQQPIELTPIPADTSPLGQQRLLERTGQIRKNELEGNFAYARNAAEAYEEHILENQLEKTTQEK